MVFWKWSLLVYVFLFLFNNTFAQSNEKTLRRLDSVAFNALEHNDPNVLSEANSLLDASLKVKNSLYRVNAYTLLGIINKNRGFYVSSLDYYLKALSAAEQLNDVPRISACLNNIGSIYQLQGKYSEAIDYFNRSLKIENELNQPLQKSIRYYNIGECYKDVDSLDLALTYFNNSLILEKRAKNNEGIAYALLGIADVYIKLDRLIDVEIVFDDISKVSGKDRIEEQIIFRKLKGKYFKAKKDYSNALEELKKGIDLSNRYKIKTHLLGLLKEEISIYKMLGDFAKASDRYEELLKLTEEMNSLQVKNQLDDLNYRNELNKKQLEIELVQEERDLAMKNELLEKELRLYSQKVNIFVVFILIITIVLIVFGIRKLMQLQR